MVKESYDTDVKRKVIEKQRDLIKRNLIQKSKRNTKNLRVAFFPGKEALEYQVAYKPLGILQENITAIERYKPNFRYWKKNSSFNMSDKPIEAIDFFKNYKGTPFDIISLDYDGMFNEKVLKTLYQISGNGLLNDKSVFVVNLYAQREQEKIKTWYNLPIACQEILRTIVHGEKNPFIEKASGKKEISGEIHPTISIKNISDSLSEDMNLSYLRDQGTREIFVHAFLCREFGKPTIPKILCKDPLMKEVNKKIKIKMQKMNEEEIKFMGGPELAESQLKAYFMTQFILRLEEYLINKGHSNKLAAILSAVPTKPYYPVEIESYSYISDKGATMNTDLYFLDQRLKIINKYQEMYDSLYTSSFKEGPFSDFNVRIMNSMKLGKAIIKRKKDYEKRCEKLKVTVDPNRYREKIPSRIFLGSSQKPLIRSKKRLKELVKQGLSKEEIEEKYIISDLVKGSLSSYLAHKTMGKYEVEGKIKEDPIEKQKESQNIKNKTKKQKNKRENLKLIPHKDYENLVEEENLSENIRLRMKYFRKDTKNLSKNRKKQLYDSLIKSNWFRDFNKRKISDLEVYAFFDDLMLNFVHQKRRISSERIKYLWDEILNSEKLYEVTYTYEQKPIKKPKISKEQNQEIYEYIIAGIDDESIMEEFDLSKQQLGARKAWITMKNKTN